ncbi:20-hydroxyecdysone protein [Lucilia sericata]|uniref:20-hydroxyecdysone protein n=1 Tax=Lucilia sericata TaxID=13632 RepID=UPI0018A838CF|nr:20-hydroxyecdysone protein [Lucilia sericata]
MRFFSFTVGLLLVIALCESAVVPRRTYRNTEEILVPVTIIQDGEEIKATPQVTENETVPEVRNSEAPATQEETVAAVAVPDNEEQNLEAIEAVAVEAQRRIDEAIVEEEIKEAVQEEQQQEIEQAVEEENRLRSTLPVEPQTVTVIQPAVVAVANEAVEQVAVAAPAPEDEEAEKALDLKSVVVEQETPNRVVVVIESSNEEVEQPEGSVRQATQATPTQSSTQQNFVQQLIQNSPLGQFFNQITGQPGTQVANDETQPAAPAPTLPGLFNPVTAVQNAAQSVVNSTTQAFQGLQQFASNIGSQFQNTLSGLAGQQQEGANDATTARPPGPIQQLVNTFMGNNGQQAQPAPTQQGPLQGLLNIFQGNNRPQTATAAAVVTNPEPQPAKEPEVPEETPAAAVNENTVDETISNEVRADSAEANDSFEDTVQPDELIVVNDDPAAGQTDTEQDQEVAAVGSN